MNTQTTTASASAAAPRQARGPSSARSVEWVVQRVVALLEDHQIGTGPDPAALDELAVAARCVCQPEVAPPGRLDLAPPRFRSGAVGG